MAERLNMCLFAVQHDGRALEFVPEALKSSEVCLAALKNDYCYESIETGLYFFGVCRILNIIKYVPEKIQTKDIISLLIKELVNYESLYLMNCYHNIYVDDKDCEDRIDYHNQAIRLFPDQSELYACRGHAYRIMRKEEKAQADFEKARELGCESGDWYGNIIEHV